MKEIRSIINAYAKIDFEATKAALVTVVGVEGSSYRRTGARMLVLDNGTYLGGVSGGCLEGDALRRAQKAIFQNKPSIITYDTTQDDGHQVGVGLGCNGIIDVLITPLHNDTEDPVRLLSSISGTRVLRILISIIECADIPGLLGKTILFETEEQFLKTFPIKDISISLLNDIKQATERRSSANVTYAAKTGSTKVFIEVIAPAIHIIIYGSNHDMLPLAAICSELGWDITVITDIAKANKLLLQKATNILDRKSDHRPVTDNYSAIVLMSHDYKTDFNNLKEVLQMEASYIGLLGPRKRSEKMFDELRKDISVSEQSMKKVYAPCGLDIGAANPEEIALSIVSEIQAHFAGRNGMSLKFRPGKIYSN